MIRYRILECIGNPREGRTENDYFFIQFSKPPKWWQKTNWEDLSITEGVITYEIKKFKHYTEAENHILTVLLSKQWYVYADDNYYW